MLLHFVLNPRAARGLRGGIEPVLRREFRGHEVRISVDPPGPESIGDARAIVAVGGDGTVNRVLGAVRECGVPLGILPRGTANDLARALGIPRDLPGACAVIREGRVLDVDLATVNGVPFATCGGIGLAAEAAARANRWRNGPRDPRSLPGVPGAGIYLAAALCAIGRRPESLPVRMRLGGREETRPVASLLFSNQARFGGRFTASPEARNRDGLLDLCRIDAPASRPRLLRIALGMLGGGPADGRGVSRERGRSFDFRCGRETDFFGDGEVLARGRDFRVRVLPGALRVLAPEAVGTPSPGGPDAR